MTYLEFLSDVKKYSLSHNYISVIAFSRDCNGCGSKGGVHFPSTMWGVNIEAACNIHDFDWSEAESYTDLVKANERFDNNLKKICDEESNSFTRWFRRMRVAKYVSGVELVGTSAFAREQGLIGGCT